MTRGERAFLAGVSVTGVAAMLVLSLAPEGWPIVAALEPEWFNAAHLPAYFVVTAVSAWWTAQRPKHYVRRLLWVGLSIYAAGVLIEFVQPLVGRTFSTRDLALNAIGVLAALSVAAAMHYGTVHRAARRAAKRPGRR